jgi:hypothetical protein
LQRERDDGRQRQGHQRDQQSSFGHGASLF